MAKIQSCQREKENKKKKKIICKGPTVRERYLKFHTDDGRSVTVYHLRCSERRCHQPEFYTQAEHLSRIWMRQTRFRQNRKGT